MAYDSVISRSDAQALVPEEVSNAMLKKLSASSAVLSRFTRVPISRNQERFPVLSALPIAGFVNGDTGLKATTEANWDNKYLNVEEIACICPIPEAVLDDASYDIWGQVQPLMEQAIGRTLDAAVFFGTNKPSSWPDDIATAAAAAGNTVTRGANDAAHGGIVGDFSDAFGTVEADGYDVDWVVASRVYRGFLRQARATTGESLIEPDDGQVNAQSVHGISVDYPMRGLWPTGGSHPVEAIVGDPAEQVVGVRQDITYKLLDQAVIQDNTGKIVYNLAQQDMVAMRVVFRAGWQTANTINWDNQDNAERYPAAVVLKT
jgi:HK97 family phage major capsid protein